jgi:concanavalin A-like lectin/glucanase superfamily protein
VLKPIPRRKPFTLELILRPAAAEAPGAEVAGNSGQKGVRPCDFRGSDPFLTHQGFAIEHVGDNHYTLSFGDTSRSNRALGFGLEPERWHYLAVVAEGALVKVYVDGKLAAEPDTVAEPLSPSARPLRLGRRPGDGPAFRGTIAEVRVLPEVLPPGEIAANQALLARKLRGSSPASPPPRRAPSCRRCRRWPGGRRPRTPRW